MSRNIIQVSETRGKAERHDAPLGLLISRGGSGGGDGLVLPCTWALGTYGVYGGGDGIAPADGTLLGVGTGLAPGDGEGPVLRGGNAGGAGLVVRFVDDEAAGALAGVSSPSTTSFFPSRALKTPFPTRLSRARRPTPCASM